MKTVVSETKHTALIEACQLLTNALDLLANTENLYRVKYAAATQDNETATRMMEIVDAYTEV